MALALAERTGGVVINADSAQVYRDLRILSARPSTADEARATHRLYGHVDGAAIWSAADWAVAARAEIAAAHAAGRLPILVGGTGLYLHVLLNGIAPIPPVDDAIRDAVRALPVATAHAALLREDPAAAARLRPRDTTRIARALEVVRATGRPIHEWQAMTAGGIADAVTLTPVVIEPAREALYARCDARFAAMIAEGALDEVAALVERGLPAPMPVMKALGVAPLARHLAGELTLDAAIAEAAQQTRNYAKRQMTWLRGRAPGWPRHPDPASGLQALLAPRD